MVTTQEAGEPATERLDTRRGEIIAAALRVIERDGLHAASVRAIAREMGCTTGVLSHHFRTKDDLTALACSEVTRAIARRVTAADTSGEPRQQLLNTGLAVLPDDPDSNQAWIVWLHFLGVALQRPELMERHSRATVAVRRHIGGLLREFRSRGVVGADLDPEFEANYLFALLEGLGTHSYISPDVYGPHSFATFVTEHLNRLLLAHPPTEQDPS
jgi:AcrR family transcriptional regulator